LSNPKSPGAVITPGSSSLGHQRNLTAIEVPHQNQSLLENFLSNGKVENPMHRHAHFANAGLISYPSTRPLTALTRRPLGGSVTRAPTPGGTIYKGQLPLKPSEMKDFESNDVMFGALKSTKMNIDRGSSVISSFVFNTSVLGEGPAASK
jgi:hypothetical protein